jgi:hypothetical protein
MEIVEFRLGKADWLPVDHCGVAVQFFDVFAAATNKYWPQNFIDRGKWRFRFAWRLSFRTALCTLNLPALEIDLPVFKVLIELVPSLNRTEVFLKSERF